MPCAIRAVYWRPMCVCTWCSHACAYACKANLVFYATRTVWLRVSARYVSISRVERCIATELKLLEKKFPQTFRKSTGRGTYEITIKRDTRRDAYDLRSTPRIFRKLAFHRSDAEKFECAASVSPFVKINCKRLYVRGVAWKNWTRSISWFLRSSNFLHAETFLWNCIWKSR